MVSGQHYNLFGVEDSERQKRFYRIEDVTGKSIGQTPVRKPGEESRALQDLADMVKDLQNKENGGVENILYPCFFSFTAPDEWYVCKDFRGRVFKLNDEERDLFLSYIQAECRRDKK